MTRNFQMTIITNFIKCKNMVIRELFLAIALLGGFPAELAVVYLIVMSDMEYVAALASGIGKPRKHKRGIPQGDPLAQVIFLLGRTSGMSGLRRHVQSHARSQMTSRS